MIKNKTIVHIVPSTHWDREWYLPFRRFQVRLIRLFDKVLSLLEHEDYPNFLMDGQWIVLQDYLEIKPQQEELLKKRIAEGKLTFGPWYVVPDMFCVSGESLVHNLQIGLQFQKKYGRELPVGYSPDSFGLPAQLPQIYRQFGFQSAMFTRGRRVAGRETMELNWYAPDGTCLPAQAGTYLRGIGLAVPSVWANIERFQTPPREAVAEARRLLAEDNTFTDLYNRLWIVGIDHLEPKQNLPELVISLDREIEDAAFVFSDMETYFEAFVQEMSSRQPTEAYGEQRGPYKEHFILGNTLSARMDLKMKNRAAEDRLSYIAHPLLALNGTDRGFGCLDSRSILDFAWKLLIQNHAHDSICCCCVDSVMQDVQNRLDKCLQMTREVEKEEVKRLGSRVSPLYGNGALLVYNALPFARSGRIDQHVVVPYDVDGCVLVDDQGNPVDAAIEVDFQRRMDIESLKTNEYGELLTDSTRILLGSEAPQDIYTGLHIAFCARNIPACGYACYYFVKGKSRPPVPAEDSPLQNAYIRVDIQKDGTLTIHNKKNGKVLEKTHYFEIQEDEGDTYTVSPKGEICTTKGRNADIVYGDHQACVTHRLRLPWGSLEIATTVELQEDHPELVLRTRIQNQCRNVRIRAVLEYPEGLDRAVSDTAYDLTERPVFDKGELNEKNIQTMPMRNLLYLPFRQGGEAVFSNSVQEYECIRDGDRTIASLTLLRAVGKVYALSTLTKDETSVGDGVRWWSEQAQMQGAFCLEYALRSYSEEASPEQWMNEALSFAVPLKLYGIAAMGTAPARRSLCEMQGAVLTSIESGEGRVCRIRGFNPAETSSSVVIRAGRPVFRAAKYSLSGEPLEELALESADTVVFKARKHEIFTVQVVWGEDYENGLE